MVTSPVANFNNFGVVGIILVAMLGVGLAEEAGLIGALIRLLVRTSPRRLITFIIVLIGILSSVATDAGYLAPILLAAAAFHSMGRHPLAGLAAGFAGVGAAFGVNLLIAPIDGMMTEVANESIALVDPSSWINDVTANYFFAVVSTSSSNDHFTAMTEKVIEPRLGVYGGRRGRRTDRRRAARGDPRPAVRPVRVPRNPGRVPAHHPAARGASPERGDRRHLRGLAVHDRHPRQSSACCSAWPAMPTARVPARSRRQRPGQSTCVAKTTKGSPGSNFLLPTIAQFIAFFNYTNIATVLAIAPRRVRSRPPGIGALPLLIGIAPLTALFDMIIPGVIPKWAIFAPIFVPLFLRLGIAPQIGLAAYRVADSPLNVVTPLMVYLAVIVAFAQRYEKQPGIGTIVALMMPWVIAILLVWTVFLVLWFVLGFLLGPGAPVQPE